MAATGIGKAPWAIYVVALLAQGVPNVTSMTVGGRIHHNIDQRNASRTSVTQGSTYRITFTKSHGNDNVCLNEIEFAKSDATILAATYVSATSCYSCASCDVCTGSNYGHAHAALDGISNSNAGNDWWCTSTGSYSPAGSESITFQLPEHPATYSLLRYRTGSWVAASWLLEELMGDGSWNVLSTVIDEPISTVQGPFAIQASQVSAAGDPHLRNVFGERFDLMRPGQHVLMNIPRGGHPEKALLRVQADARQLGGACTDMYFQQLNITGSWATAKQDGGYHYTASQDVVGAPTWLALGKVEVKVVHGRTQANLPYLNFYVKNLGRTGLPVGGLLGEDDHSGVDTSPEGCLRKVSLGHGMKSIAVAM